MPRGPRLDAPGVLHHAMVRRLGRQRIFRDDRDRRDLLGRSAPPLTAALGVRGPSIYRAAARGRAAERWGRLLRDE